MSRFTPETIERVYGLPVTVLAHPTSGRPVVLPDTSRNENGASV